MSDGNPFEALSKELKEQRLDKNINQTVVGRVLGMQQQTVSTHESTPEKIIGKGPEFTTEFLRLYKFTEKRIGQVLREFFPSTAEVFEATYEPMHPDSFQRVNIYAAGTGPAWGDEEVLEEMVITGLDGTDYIGLRATGESMTPYLNRGDIAIVKCDDGIVAPGDYVAVWFSDDGCVVKRFVAEVSDTLMLESLNPGPTEDRVFTAPPGSRVLGKVVRRLLGG